MPRRIEFPSYKRRMDEVRRELEAKGITQIELGAKARLPNWQIGRLLSGALPEDIEDLRRFCEAVGRPIGLFLLEDPEIEELIEFHGHGPSRGKAQRRQGRRTAGSLVLALMCGAASVLGWPPSDGVAAEPRSLGVVQVLDNMLLIRLRLRRLLDWWARPLLPLGYSA